MKLNQHDIKNASKELIERLHQSDLRSRLPIVFSRNWEVIVAALAALVVGVLLLFMR